MATKFLLSRLALGGALTTTSTVSGAIVVFDINPDQTFADNDYHYFGVDALNFNNATFTPVVGNTGALFGFGTDYYAVAFRVGSSSYVRVAGYAGNRLSMLSLGDSVDYGASFLFTASNSNSANSASGIRYMGLRLEDGLDYHYGWLEFQFTELDEFGNRDYTFTRFAFNDVAGQSILAGQTIAVPEASTLGLVGGLFGLVAAAHARRRKAKQAAASDKFLSLAAGEKLN
jgi:hypothetical protein